VFGKDFSDRTRHSTFRHLNGQADQFPNDACQVMVVGQLDSQKVGATPTVLSVLQDRRRENKVDTESSSSQDQLPMALVVH
jgi:hypothetical protein